MKKNKNKTIEMRIYELLGVKIFKKIVMKLYDRYFHYLNIFNGSRNSYTIGKIKNLEDINSFKKMLLFNFIPHLIGILAFLLSIPSIINGVYSVVELIEIVITTIINVYCTMLQRYNWIRINQVIKKQTPKYEQQKEEMKEKLMQTDSQIKPHSYKIINIRKRTEKNITFEELLETANIKQLKKYRELLEDYKKYKLNESLIYINPTLRLELVKQKKNPNNGKKDDRN